MCGVSVRGPWRRFHGPWQVYRYTVVRLLEDSLHRQPLRYLVGDSERERCREMERAFCGRTALLTYRGSFAGSLLHGTSTLAAALQVFWCFTATLTDRYRVRSAPLASRSGRRHRAFLFYRHPASVPCASFSASCRKRRSAHDARSPLGRSGAVCVRRSKPPHFAFPTLGRCAPANAASALTAARLAFHAAFAGWHPATGLRHAATSMSPLAQ
ncbi:hypothetical protein FB106_1273 [Synechococcus sp. Ace-Pa]|nr:hypothetical protein FB106_1273 [Synechococcus sp. Ace-Pa]